MNGKIPLLCADLIRMLDNVLQYFIDNAPTPSPRAKYSAARERSLGLGAMGFHSLLQKHAVAWESDKASEINDVVFSHIRDEPVSETETLGKSVGNTQTAWVQVDGILILWRLHQMPPAVLSCQPLPL